MQLAAMQRPHAPPVPPRPTRQIVAEALKRSARLPCPTRQAPPPPNVKPWRPPIDKNNHEKSRNVVYESVVEKTQKSVDKSEKIDRKLPINSSIATDLSDKKNATTNATSNNINIRSDVTKTIQPIECNDDFRGSTTSDSNAETKMTVVVTKNSNNLNVNVSNSRVESTGEIINDDNTVGSGLVVDKLKQEIVVNHDSNENIQHEDWLEAGIRYSSTKITLPGDEQKAIGKSGHLGGKSNVDLLSLHDRIGMSSLQGLPPLPRSLSGFNLNEGRREACEPPPPPARSSSKVQKGSKNIQPTTSRPSPPGRQLTTLDTQLAILRKEMFGLRQLDLSLLSQLWSLNESIQEFRQLIQDQEDRAPSPSPSSEDGDEVTYSNHPPVPPPRPASLHHHHRPTRLTRPLRPLPSDESPSSEEYGAV